MATPTQDQINEAIKRLKEIKPKVRRYTAFSDDNWAVIQAQIDTLESDYSEDEIYDAWPDDDQSRERDAALEVRAWLDGEEIEDDLVEGWSSLVGG